MSEEVNNPTEEIDEEDKEITVGTLLRAIMHDRNIKYWVTPDGDVLATFRLDGEPWQTHSIESAGFKHLIYRVWYKLHNYYAILGKETVKDLCHQIIDQALAKGEPLEWNVRMHEVGNKLYIDLGNKHWDSIKIAKGTWEHIGNTPIPFLRGTGIRPWYIPKKGGNVDLLKKYINYASEEQFKLIIGFLVAALDKRREYPILSITGVQRSGKTTLTNILNSLVQGQGAENAQILDNNIRNIGVTARNNWLVSFENVSNLPFKISDALCQLSTGFTYRERKLYDNGTEFAYTVYRPVILNGINNVITRGDLMRRTIAIRLPKMEDDDVENKELLMDNFVNDAPLILGALLDAVAYARENPRRSSRKPEGGLVSLCDVLEAASPALGWEEGEFVTAYNNMLGEMRRTGLENDIFAKEIMTVLEKNNGFFSGCYDEFMSETSPMWRYKYSREDWYPKSPQRFANHLDRIAPDMESLYKVEIKRQKRKRYNTKMATAWSIRQT